MTAPAARALVASLVDYAGLFPPAALSMAEAVAEYARWRRSPQAWVLGRFVVPAARLAELAAALPEASEGQWDVSALVGGERGRDLGHVDAFNAAGAGRGRVDSVELKASSWSDVAAALEAVPKSLAAYVELPAGADLAPLLRELRARGGRAKIRTGGVVPEAIPSAGEVAGFVAACAAADVPFKATAGLHHALRAEHALAYGEGAPRAVVHGFLNVFAAAVFARGGASPAELEAVLREQDRTAFRLDDSALAWRHRRASAEDVARCRAGFALSFGSCSLAEPVEELRALELL